MNLTLCIRNKIIVQCLVLPDGPILISHTTEIVILFSGLFSESTERIAIQGTASQSITLVKLYSPSVGFSIKIPESLGLSSDHSTQYFLLQIIPKLCDLLKTLCLKFPHVTPTTHIKSNVCVLFFSSFMCIPGFYSNSPREY